MRESFEWNAHRNIMPSKTRGNAIISSKYQKMWRKPSNKTYSYYTTQKNDRVYKKMCKLSELKELLSGINLTTKYYLFYLLLPNGLLLCWQIYISIICPWSSIVNIIGNGKCTSVSWTVLYGIYAFLVPVLSCCVLVNKNIRTKFVDLLKKVNVPVYLRTTIEVLYMRC